ncbi:hypothetical protein [Mesorhizobium sp. M0802]|uniref:hypothetical protein n=1 Tax=Mesorhizobium sp. M0802 TaxID=2957001 RepID=UPI00333607C0
MQNGYWWAINLQKEGDRPEIIEISGQMATRISDSWPYGIFDFKLIQHIDTGPWPQEGTVDPAKVREGYWWAFDPHEEAHQIVLVFERGSVQDFNGDIDRFVADYEFLMPIDTSAWPVASDV